MKLPRRLADAEAALATLNKAVPMASTSPIERDSAILRLVYTFATVSQASSHLLAESEGIESDSPNATMGITQRLGWLSDEDAEAAMRVGRDRDLAFQMYRAGVGDETAMRLPAHAAVLRRWLDALQQRAAKP